MDENEMYVTKRNGSIQIVSFDKISKRIKTLGTEAGIKLNYTALVMKVIDQLYDKISTTKLDELSAEQCASMASIHPDYNVLAGRIVVSNHHKNTEKSFSDVMCMLYNAKDKHNEHSPLVSKELYDCVLQHRELLDSWCDYSRDYLIDYFGFRTLERAYLMKLNKKIMERPQHMWMRVAIGIHGNNIERVKETYDMMSLKYFTHATPTLFNAGTPNPQLSSCFLVAMEKDSIEGIYNTLKDCALISKWAGGIGLHIHNVRASGSHIRGTNGSSNGIVPMLKVFNNTAKYVDQCFVGSTRITCADGTITTIDKLEVGQTIRTFSGIPQMREFGMEHFRRTNEILSVADQDVVDTGNIVEESDVIKAVNKYEYTGKIMRISIKPQNNNIIDIYVTEKHPILVIDFDDLMSFEWQLSSGKLNSEHKEDLMQRSSQIMQWIEVGDLDIAKHYIVSSDDVYGPVYPIVSITSEDYSGMLYDLEMTKNPNYIVESCIIAHNGGGKRNGSFAIYLEPWHSDIEMFLQMRKNHGDEELKARDLFYALWIPDLFMERVKSGGTWTLMCPDECRGLSDVHGDAFVELYTSYEKAGKGRKTMPARELWFQILDAQMETGTPYLCYKDHANQKSNQKNLGTIKSSNLCSEIIEYSDENETAVCNLASIALPSFVDMTTNSFNFAKLHEIAMIVTYNLNKVIDVNYYPTEKTRRSNMRHRPIGIGVQGLADVFMMLKMSFISEEAQLLNRQIFETIYHGAVMQSIEIAKQEGPYDSFAGSPASKGILQFDMWGVTPTLYNDWSTIKGDLQRFGMRNSLLLAPMPTASTSQILGFNECIEPITSNIYGRRTLAGEFIIANKYLMAELIKLDMWNDRIKNSIIANNGSIQQIDTIPEDIRNRYKTVWELPMKALIDMAADRGAYICQSQSLNLWLEEPTYNTLTSMHFYAWSKGLKTGIYYLRRRAAHKAQQFTIEPEKNNQVIESQEEGVCEMCSA
jgi:ribonucleoside-diphosphate reductase alpha subunit